MKILVTGAAGFIGFNTAKRLLENDHQVIGLDNVNDYYDVNLRHFHFMRTTLKTKTP